MTIDDLVKLYRDALKLYYQNPLNDWNNGGVDALCVSAVVRALRDEIVPQYWKLTDLSTVSAHDLRRFFNEILGSDAEFCEWTKKGAGTKTQSACGWSYHDTPPFQNCKCGKPIKIVEAS